MTQSEFARTVGTIHTKLLEAKNRKNLSIKFQIIKPEDLPGAARLADIALNKPKTFTLPKCNPQQGRGNSNQYSPAKASAAPPSHSNQAWYYAKDYKTTDLEVLKNIDQVLLRLEYPFGRDNDWCRIVISFILYSDLWQAEDVSVLKAQFTSKFGPEWKAICEDEKHKMIFEMASLHGHLEEVSPEKAFKGHRDFTDKHATLAGIGKLFAKLEKS